MIERLHRARGRVGLVAALLLAFVTACGWAASAASPPVPAWAPVDVAAPSGVPGPAVGELRLADADEQRLLPFIEVDAQARAALERAELQAGMAAERLRAEVLELKVNNGKGPRATIAYRSPDQTEAHLYWVDVTASVAAPEPVPRE